MLITIRYFEWSITHREIHLFSLTKAYIFYVVLFYYIYIYVRIVNILIWRWELSPECHFSVASPVILFRHIFLSWWRASISQQSPGLCLSLVLEWHAQVTTYCSCGWGGVTFRVLSCPCFTGFTGWVVSTTINHTSKQQLSIRDVRVVWIIFQGPLYIIEINVGFEKPGSAMSVTVSYCISQVCAWNFLGLGYSQ